AVDELLHRARVLFLVGDNERQKGDCLARTGGHLQDAVTFGIEASLQLTHVRILLWVDVIVGEEHLEIVNFDPAKRYNITLNRNTTKRSPAYLILMQCSLMV